MYLSLLRKKKRKKKGKKKEKKKEATKKNYSVIQNRIKIPDPSSDVLQVCFGKHYKIIL